MGDLHGSTVLVTGGAGFLGAHLCRRLRAAGSRVVATSRREQPERIEGVEWCSPDLEDPQAVRRLLQRARPDVVYHLAGEVSADPDPSRVLPTFHSLLGSTVNLLGAALETGRPRIVLAGSLTEPDDDGEHPVPSSPYAAAKWAASGYGRMFTALYGLPTVIVRPFMTYGPGQKPEKLVPYVMGCCLRGEAPRLSSGRQRADWVYVEDVVAGMLAVATAEGVVGETLDLGTGSLVRARDLVETIVELSGTRVRPEFGALPDRPLERERVADRTRSCDLLGWKPEVGLREGLSKTLESLRSAG